MCGGVAMRVAQYAIADVDQYIGGPTGQAPARCRAVTGGASSTRDAALRIMRGEGHLIARTPEGVSNREIVRDHSKHPRPSRSRFSGSPRPRQGAGDIVPPQATPQEFGG